jgi:hypothetical protein
MNIYSTGVRQEYIIASKLSKNQDMLLNGIEYKVIAPSQYFAQEKEYIKIVPKDKRSNYEFGDNYEDKLKLLSKKGIKYIDGVQLRIISFNEKLIHKIIEILPEFFVIENFGTRSGKGFGSFTVESMELGSENLQFDNVIENFLTNNYDFVYKKTFNGQQCPFAIIHKDYKLIKAGHGHAEGYKKSILFCYFANQNIRWEKRWLKQQIKPLTGTNKPFNGYELKQENGDPIDIDSKTKIDYSYIRALLGLAESFDFQTMDRDKKIHVKLQFDDSLTRFKSPIIFKIISNQIYLVGKDNIPTQFLHDHSPTFKIEKKERENIVIGSEQSLSNDPIKIPTSFSLKEFIGFCMDNNDRNVHRINGYTNLKDEIK